MSNFDFLKDEFLLLPNIREVSLNYPENGIVYSKLLEEEKEKYESLFDEDNTKLGKSLSSRIFENKIKMIYKLQNLEYQMDEKYKKLWGNLVNEVYTLISGLNEENISVRTKISYVKKYKNIDSIKNLEEKDVDEIIKNLSSLPFPIHEKNEIEKKMENI